MKEKKNIRINPLFFSLIKISLELISIFLLIFLLIQLIVLLNSFFFDPKLRDSIFGLIIISISFLSVVFVISINEYKQKFIRRNVTSKGKSYLSMEDIFQNENRISIIKQIIDMPGIHHNELMRHCNLQKGQLQWHLDVLLRNHIIKKEIQGQYTTYFPNLISFEPSLEHKKGIIQTSTSSKILEEIKNSPGINASTLAKKENLAKNTIKYHIDKLIQANLIYIKKVGRKKELYPLNKKIE